MKFVYIFTILLLVLVGAPSLIEGGKTDFIAEGKYDPALQKFVEDAVDIKLESFEKLVGKDKLDEFKAMAMEQYFSEMTIEPEAIHGAERELHFIGDIIDGVVNLTTNIIADILTAIICEFDIDSVINTIGDTLVLPDITATLGFDQFNITVLIDTVEAERNFNGSVLLDGEGPQVFDVVVKNENFVEATMAATVENANLEVDALISGDVNAKVAVTAGRLPMNIDLFAADMPLELRVDGDVLPFDADIKSDEFVMNLKVKSFSFSLAPLVMAAILFIFFVFMTMLVVRVQYVLQSMKSMLDTLVDNSGEQRLRFCHKCGKRNGHDAKYCHGFFCGAKLEELMDEDEELSQEGDLKNFNPGH